MGSGTFMRILGACEALAMLAVVVFVGLVAAADRRNPRRRLLAIVAASSVLGLAAWATRYVPALRDWVYVPLQALLELLRGRV